MRKDRERDWEFDDEELDDDEEDISEVLQRRTEELYSIPDASADEQGLIECPVLPLRDVVVYPQMVSPLFVGREISLLAVESAQVEGETMVALIQSDPDLDEPGVHDFLPIGVEMAVGRMLRMPDGSSSALVQARRRVQLVDFVQTEPFMIARARPLEEHVNVTKRVKATMRTALELFNRCVQLNRSVPEEAYLFALNIDDPGWLADMVATAINPSLQKRHELLLLLDPMERLKRVNSLLAEEVDVLELEDEIQTRTQNEVDRSQREYYLREQMRVIQTELGDNDPWTRELAELRSKIEEANLPEEVLFRASKEIDRLVQMPAMSPEVGIIRTYLEWILDLPWNAMTEDNLDVANAARVLEKYHFGLPKAKDRILEYIAVRSLKPKKARQPILCFVGPPGTGKTSLGRSIAEALGRKFVRISLGGVRDEAEIRGHRRTYIGALPGRILQTMRRANSKNPLFMLDEIDKLGFDYRGDPAAAMLEVLDVEQNHAFSDHYLELPFDLSQVMFITTANYYGTIPAALLDRMEIIEFPGYIEEEKVEIARRFLLPRQLEESGLDEEDIRFSDQSLQSIIREYTFEAGVRNLEREIGRVCRKLARQKAEGKSFPHQISGSVIERFLGPPEFFDQQGEQQDEVGVATALAWTENGGEIMPVEVMLTEGKGNIQITGQIGNVMQESAHAGLTYVKSRSKTLDLDPELFENLDIHIHIPEGSIPKDGPSAGITIATALTSAFTERAVHKEIGMTGEITLRGKVLPVGGVREKVLAAHRAGLKTVLIPKKNEKDLIELPKKARKDLLIIPVEHIDQVLEIALFPPAPRPSRKPRKRKAENQDSVEAVDGGSGA